ncbi:MAG: TMEM165/GDT1 family protein [Alphaproteobacteria bacterium]|nr:TMEM165/GDT1 family protein [Alphaproteobacteria bacterium]
MSSSTSVLAIFLSVFIAELGDKTQIATLLFAASGTQSPLAVFGAAALALIASTAAAVLLGSAASRTLAAVPLDLIAGVGFVLIGAWTIARSLNS